MLTPLSILHHPYNPLETNSLLSQFLATINKLVKQLESMRIAGAVSVIHEHIDNEKELNLIDPLLLNVQLSHKNVSSRFEEHTCRVLHKFSQNEKLCILANFNLAAIGLDNCTEPQEALNIIVFKIVRDTLTLGKSSV